MTVRRRSFGRLADGRTVESFTLANARGTELKALTLGCTITSLKVPDGGGRLEDVVLGFDDLEGYTLRSRFFSAVVGRFANRIAQARFTLEGRTYTLPANQPPHHLHGGPMGLHRALWEAEPAGEASVAFRHTSPDGDEGYPGTLRARVTYTLTGTDEVLIDYEAESDRPTPVSLTQHAYFNLGGEGKGEALAHRLLIEADFFLEVQPDMIPTGALRPVAGTPFDFRSPVAIGARIDADDEQLRRGQGYDHNFVVRREGPGLVRAARATDPGSGRTLEVRTTEPGVQFYSGNKLDGKVGKQGHVYGPRSGFCLETQRFPDTPNRPEFPPALVRPEEPYRSRTVWAFSHE